MLSSRTRTSGSSSGTCSSILELMSSSRWSPALTRTERPHPLISMSRSDRFIQSEPSFRSIPKWPPGVTDAGQRSTHASRCGKGVVRCVGCSVVLRVEPMIELCPHRLADARRFAEDSADMRTEAIDARRKLEMKLSKLAFKLDDACNQTVRRALMRVSISGGPVNTSERSGRETGARIAVSIAPLGRLLRRWSIVMDFDVASRGPRLRCRS